MDAILYNSRAVVNVNCLPTNPTPLPKYDGEKSQNCLKYEKIILRPIIEIPYFPNNSINKSDAENDTYIKHATTPATAIKLLAKYLYRAFFLFKIIFKNNNIISSTKSNKL